MASLLIKGGRVLSPEDNLDGLLDVRIEDGVITEIGPNLAAIIVFKQAPQALVLEAFDHSCRM